jgi:hypothetical protein
MTTESPYDPPKSSLVDLHHSDVSRKGRYVVLDPEIEWPSRCFKCNEKTEIKKEVTLTYVNPWIYLSILFTILLTIILVMIFRKKFKTELPLCEQHIKKRKYFLLFQWAMVAIMAVGIVIGVLTSTDILLALSAFVFLVILISAIFGRLAFAAKLKNGKIFVSGAGKDFLNSLPDYVS